MRGDELLAIVVVVLGGVGTWLMLPHAHGTAKPRSLHAAGAALAGMALVGLLGFCWAPGPWLSAIFFYGFAFAALAGAVLMITSRSPVHSALWFASVVLATSGLFLLAGAQFLAAGTIIVYAGAIIVTFLFVIMLAQAGGEATYDRAARAPGRAALSGFLLFWALLYSILQVRNPDGPLLDELDSAQRLVRTTDLPRSLKITRPAGVAMVVDQAVRPGTARLTDRADRLPGVPPPHVAGLGGTLYTDHLMAVEIAGTILFVALVGAAAIATPKPPVRPTPATRT